MHARTHAPSDLDSSMASTEIAKTHQPKARKTHTILVCFTQIVLLTRGGWSLLNELLRWIEASYTDQCMQREPMRSNREGSNRPWKLAVYAKLVKKKCFKIRVQYLTNSELKPTKRRKPCGELRGWLEGKSAIWQSWSFPIWYLFLVSLSATGSLTRSLSLSLYLVLSLLSSWWSTLDQCQSQFCKPGKREIHKREKRETRELPWVPLLSSFKWTKLANLHQHNHEPCRESNQGPTINDLTESSFNVMSTAALTPGDDLLFDLHSHV